MRIATTLTVLGLVTGAFAQVEPTAGQWETWVIPGLPQLRLSAPPDQNETAAELASLHDMMNNTDDTALSQIAYWNAVSPGYRWIQMTVTELLNRNIGGRRYAALGARGGSHLRCTVAAWDSKYAYNRHRPADLDPTIQPLVTYPASPSYPSEHAVAAGAAAKVMAYLFPEEPILSAAWHSRRRTLRLVAGTHFPSDISASLSLGQTVGMQVVAYAQADGSASSSQAVFRRSPAF